MYPIVSPDLLSAGNELVIGFVAGVLGLVTILLNLRS